MSIEYRDDDISVGFCPLCGSRLEGLTVHGRGFCHRHGWQWAEWRQKREREDEER
jgi:hypothetical protein